MHLTYQTKLMNQPIALPSGETCPLSVYLDKTAEYFGMIERKLFVDLHVRKKDANGIKRNYCNIYDITSRQFNSIKNQLDGKVKSITELQKTYLQDTKGKIALTEKQIAKKEAAKVRLHEKLSVMKGYESDFRKKVSQYRAAKLFLHQKKRKLHRLELKWMKLKADQQHKVVRICFGSKAFFRKQFHLEENGLTMEEWRAEWKRRRSAQLTYLGSKDETFGNQTCQYNKENRLQVRTPNKFQQEFGQTVTLDHVTFPYGQEQLDKAKTPYAGLTKGGKKATYYRALTHRFVRKERGWYLFTSVEVDDEPLVTIEGNGMVGIDFNANFLSVSELDRFGNPLHSFDFPFRAEHATSEQRKQSLSEALGQAVAYAAEKHKPLVHEDLDFQQKKKQLKELSNKQAKLLSGFAYSAYKQLLAAKCAKAGVERIEVNPAYTSQIGQHKYMKRYGISSHQAAAVAIARKGMDFRNEEKVPVHHFIHVTPKKKYTIQKKKRAVQWTELHKIWKGYTFRQKMTLLQKTMN